MTTTTKAQTQMQNNTAVIDLMSFVPGKEPVTSKEQSFYMLVNENGRLLARRGGRDFWALPPWQYDRFSNFQSGVYDSRLYLEPVMRKTERTMREHQERAGGRVVKVTFGVDQFDAPIKVVFLP